ncbi:MAG: hypothetical protein CO184_00960 [Candidatus Zambryskibacteria bacterium CG_4_9_14_3_um_filter_40_16]|uniref:Ribosome-binding factor A n=2 Tax=Candidatus Zambryskiibacteriota TaxID=1817925 RepID=A0A2H0K7F8_9BACT|nr:MAG: hypothetical protein COV95_00130 [Candidatus Zambryskibacteria bacterium CG11_big_fil_rev_8_21_14_0_20_40_24]PJA33829.1 MAG: hypothetical protein CO184_00960 [Candidatus Zambryskibacteria bacterium CG_4_9_14_3_um_filter_40_16]
MRKASFRKEKLSELLAHLAAMFIEGESNRTTLITVTGAIISNNQQRAKILFTVLPEREEVSVSEFLNRKKKDFQGFIDKHARIGRMPTIEFAVDWGEKNRQKIDFLSGGS